MTRPKGPDPLQGDDPNKPPRTFGPDIKEDENAFEALVQIGEAIDAFKKPTGTRAAPARTCKDLALSHPDFDNGMYWIDPNAGSPVDAIEVYCDIKLHLTCITPSPSQVFKGVWYKGPSKHVWFGEDMEEGFPFTYKADQIQLTFLQLLSTEAYQNITYHCRNSVAYYDREEKNYDKAALFMTSNDLELVAKKPRKFRYNVVKDECQYKSENWAQTVFEFKTERTRRLPIVDFAPYDIGGDDQAFGLEIGPACFS
jgi:hypothetical protein